MSPVRERLTPEEALERVRDAVGGVTSDLHLNYGHVDLTCAPEHLPQVAAALRDAEGIHCRFFTFLSAVDRSEFGGGEDGEKAGGLEVLIHVYSPEHGVHVTVHVPVDWERPVCPSITPVYKGAMWHERECHEFYGIHFDGHPRLVNLYLPEDFEGHPGRRAFKLPGRALVKPWPGAKDPEEAAAGGR